MPTAAASRWGQWLCYCEERCKSLALADIVDNKIVRRKFPWMRGAMEPALFVTNGGLKMQQSYTELYGITATNLDIVKAYPAQITIVRVSNQDLEIDDTFLQWGERLESGFQPVTEPPAAGLDWVNTVIVEPQVNIDAGAFNKQYDVKAYCIWAVGRERRVKL